MNTNQFYFLLLVLGGFGAFAVAMVIATLQYKSWLKRMPEAAPSQPVADDYAPIPLKRAA